MTEHATTRRRRAGRAGAGSGGAAAPCRSSRRRAALASLAALLVVVGVFALPAAGGTDAGPIATLGTADFHALAFDPRNPDVVLFGHHDGVMRSTDGGHTWHPLVARPGFDAMSLAVGPGAPPRVDRLYLAGHEVFQVSTDGGASWRPVAHDLPGTDIHAFAVSPDDPSRLYAFVVGHGLLRSGDAGRTWKTLGARLPPDVVALAAAGGDPEVLYAGSLRLGLLRSADGGRRWARATEGAGAGGARALAVDPTRPRTVYAGLGGGLYKSTDGGGTWSRLPFPGTPPVAIAVSPARPDVVLAIGVRDRQGLVFRSEDGGATWGRRR